MVTIPPPPGKDTRARAAARQKLAAVLWTEDGQRRWPNDPELVTALSANTPEDVWWVCESSSAGPVYLLPTRRWVRELARWLDSVNARTVLEVAAGDGFLSRCLATVAPHLEITATDDGAWIKPGARMGKKDRAEFAGTPFAGIQMPSQVLRLNAVAAVKKFKPDVVIVSWAPPGLLVERVIRAPSSLVLDIGVEGDVCGNGEKTWRFNKEFLEGPLQDLALCRLDARPKKERATRVTLYFGDRHPDSGLDPAYQ
jgi:hypothetical protein